MKIVIDVRTSREPSVRHVLDSERTSVGRSKRCDVVIDDPKVSTRHAELFWFDGQPFVRDLNSTNGLYVNGQRWTEIAVRPGDVLRVGDALITIVEVERASPESPAQITTRDFQTLQDRLSIQVPLEGIEDRDAASDGPFDRRLIRRKLVLLARLGKEVARVRDPADQALRVAQLVRETLGPERLALLTRQGEELLPICSFDWTLPDPTREVYVPRALVDQAVSKARAVLNIDLSRTAGFAEEARVREAPIHAAMAAPLVVGEDVRGAIYVDRASENLPFTSEDLHMLAVIANQAAVILENACLFAEQRRSEEALAAKNRSLEDALERLRVAQAELVQAGKLASLGELVAGVTHELNNPLAGILGYLDLLQADTVPHSAAHDALAIVRREALRMREIVRGLQSFARRDGGPRRPVDLNEVVRAALQLLTPAIARAGVEVRCDLGQDVTVLGNMNELEQVVVNIVHNAVQAIVGAGSSTRVVHLVTRRARETVTLAIRDEGPGIRPEHLPRIFDPFFTTKPAGVGTGLGLSVSYGIVAGHGGRLSATSEPGRGATFHIELPWADARVASADAAPGTMRMARAAERRRVLVVDDEDAIRCCVAGLLERAGHDAVVLADAREALRRAIDEPFDVIVTDVSMPDLDGEQLYRRAIAARPELRDRFLFLTGDTTHGTHRALFAEVPDSFIAKPFESADLLARVLAAGRREVVAAGAS